MKCPECEAVTQDDRDNEYNWLFIHVWNYHRDKPSMHSNNQWKSVYDCPWCGLNDPRWLRCESRDKLRKEHLKECIPYIATCLAGVRIQ